MTSSNPSEGHRQRLREKFLKSGLSGFHDYEIIELLLTLGTPRKDCKQPAKDAIKKFKSLRGVLAANPKELQEIKGIGPHNAFGLKLVQEVAREFLKEKIVETPHYSSSKEMYEYLYHSMRDLKKEVFKVIYLNNQNQVMDTDDLFQGTVNSSAVHVREVMEAALRKLAASLIFAHNHPTGNPEPSQSDYAITRDLVQAGTIMQIKVLDHLIIGNNTYFSFASAGFIERCQLDFLKFGQSLPNR
jgi:DNA repair protein RadC